MDAGPESGDGGVCEPVDTCEVVFRYPRNGATAVELRGDFAEDGWTNGLPMRLADDAFEVSVELRHGQTVQYKFYVDNQWLGDPNNPDQIPSSDDDANSALLVDCNPACPKPSGYDWRDAIMYFVFVDRFFDGDSSNNAPIDGVEAPANYAGGDLAGVLQKIEEGYFTDLGVTVLWLSSPVDNTDGIGQGDDGHPYSAYHGYWPSDLEAMETRFGTLDELVAVVDAAHARGIRVILDYVMNHVHADSPVYAQHPDWFWPIDKPGGGSCVCGGDCSWDGPEARRCWFTSYLPDFDFTNAAARQYSVDNAIQWIRDTGIDGFRLDAVKHIEYSWIIDLRQRLREEIETGGELFYTVGETFASDRGVIGRYVSPDFLLTGQFDFPLRAEIARVLLNRNGSMADLASFLDQNDSAYHPQAIMSTFIGNHDLPRAIHLAEDTPLFGEWDGGKDRGWSGQPGAPQTRSAYERLGLAFTLLMTTPGIPLMYYGDEIGMAGAGDPDNRRFMQWAGLSDSQSWLRERIATLTEIRAAYPVLRHGARRTIGLSGDVYAYEMTSEAQTLTVVINRGDAAADVPGLASGSYRNLITDESVIAPLSLPARSSAILLQP